MSHEVLMKSVSVVPGMGQGIGRNLHTLTPFKKRKSRGLLLGNELFGFRLGVQGVEHRGRLARHWSHTHGYRDVPSLLRYLDEVSSSSSVQLPLSGMFSLRFLALSLVSVALASKLDVRQATNTNTGIISIVDALDVSLHHSGPAICASSVLRNNLQQIQPLQ